MLTGQHVSEIKTAAEMLRRNWKDWQWSETHEARQGMAYRLDVVVKEAAKWKPPGEPTPIKDLHCGWWFVATADGEDYVQIRRGLTSGMTNGTIVAHGPRISKHGISIEDMPEGITFYPAPSPTQLMAMHTNPKTKAKE